MTASSSTSYPAQERVGGDAKIPSLLYYDRMGFVRAVGAEVLQENNIETAGDEGRVKVEWYGRYPKLPLNAIRC